MKPWKLLICLCLAVLLCFQAVPTYASAGSPAGHSSPSSTDLGVVNGVGTGEYTNRIIVKFKDEITQSVISSINSKLADEVKRIIGKTYEILVPSGIDIQSLIKLYEDTGFVKYAEADSIVHMTSAPDDAFYNDYQAAIFSDMSIVPSWDIVTSGTTVVVAVIDTGADFNHPDLKGSLLTNGYDFVNSDSLPADDNGHGTFCSGIIAATTNNDIGVAGAGINCKILPIKALDSSGSGYTSKIAQAVYYAVDHGAKVISMSLGSSSSSRTLQDAVNYAYNAGVVVLAAAGNSNGAIEYPGACNHVISVAALEPSLARASYSCYGSQLDLAAVGSEVTSTYWSDGASAYATGSGTSFSCPFAAALAALTIEVNPSLTPDKVEALMKNNATDLGTSGWDKYYGYGCIDYYDTLLAASSHTKTLTSISVSPSSVSVAKGKTTAVTVTGKYDDSSTANLTGSCTWSSSNTSVATVSGGTITGVAAGTATITAKSGSFSATVSVTVTAPKLVSITASQTSLTVAKGKTAAVTITGKYDDGSTADLTGSCTWSSSKTSVATVSGGTITGVAAGTATITAKSGSCTATVSVTVTAPKLVSITASTTSLTLARGKTATVTITGKYDDGSTANLTSSCTWSSSKSTVAWVSSGTVIGISAGTATITAKTGSLSVTINVTVKK